MLPVPVVETGGAGCGVGASALSATMSGQKLRPCIRGCGDAWAASRMLRAKSTLVTMPSWT